MKKPRTFLLPWLVLAPLLAWEWLYATPYFMLASIAYACMVSGVLIRKFSLPHSRFMATALLLDLALVLTLQIQRNAVQEAASFELSGLQYLHIGFSTLATVLYFPILWSGYRLKYHRAQCSPNFRARHIRLGCLAFIFRTIGFIFMFTIIDHVKKGV